MAITSNKRLFDFSEKSLNTLLETSRPSASASERERRDLLIHRGKVLDYLIIEGIKIKAKIVEKDEKESDDRMILNFGHTVGHALEQLSGFQLPHGFAVAFGVIAESKISELEGLLHKAEFERIKLLMVKSGLDVSLLKKWLPRKSSPPPAKTKKPAAANCAWC